MYRGAWNGCTLFCYYFSCSFVGQYVAAVAEGHHVTTYVPALAHWSKQHVKAANAAAPEFPSCICIIYMNQFLFLSAHSQK